MAPKSVCPFDTPIKPKRLAPGTALNWLNDHIHHRGDECLIWPFGRFLNGYAVVRWKGQNRNASRVMCILVNGDPPDDAPFSLHSCGNGKGGCVHPGHVRWGTQAENIADACEEGTISRGENRPASKLTTADVLAIRASDERPGALAKRYGVHPDRITLIRKRKAWAWLK